MKQKFNRKTEKRREEYIKALTNQYYEKERVYLADMFIPFKENISLEEFIKVKLVELEEQYSQIPKGKYQDSQKIIAEYRQKFVEFSCRLSPQIFEELREFVSHFNNLFGQQKDRYAGIFDRFRDEIFNLSVSIDREIKISLRKSNENLLEYTEINSKNWKYDFQWDEYSLCLHLVYLTIVEDLSSKKRDEITTYANNILESRLTIKSGNLAKKPVKANQKNYLAGQSKKADW